MPLRARLTGPPYRRVVAGSAQRVVHHGGGGLAGRPRGSEATAATRVDNARVGLPLLAATRRALTVALALGVLGMHPPMGSPTVDADTGGTVVVVL